MYIRSYNHAQNSPGLASHTGFSVACGTSRTWPVPSLTSSALSMVPLPQPHGPPCWSITSTHSGPFSTLSLCFCQECSFLRLSIVHPLTLADLHSNTTFSKKPSSLNALCTILTPSPQVSLPCFILFFSMYGYLKDCLFYFLNCLLSDSHWSVSFMCIRIWVCFKHAVSPILRTVPGR